MAKFLVVGDVHYRGTNPRARLDNFQEAISEKLLEVNELAIEHEVDGVLQVGDLFDSPGVGYSVVAELARILQQSHYPWYTVAGNHDIYGANQESLRRTPLGLLVGLGIVELVSDEIKTPVRLLGDRHFVGITGRGYSVDTDGCSEWYSYPSDCKSPDHDTTINIVHGMLLDKPFGYDIKHQVIDNIPNPADITIVGHEHTGFGAICRPDGKWFINPGALCRLSASNTEINRTVQVALLEIKEDLLYDNISVKMIPIHAQPGHVVLSREHIEQAEIRNERLETFLRLLGSESEAKYLELEEIMDGISKKENIPEDVVKEGLLRLGHAREIIGGRVS